MKENGKEYLKEFANSQPNWLKSLIYEVIETNGSITSDKKNEIFDSLKKNNPLDLIKPTISDDSSGKEIYLLSLEHIKGVNALKQNQTIKFQEDVTILYGLNGAGKSSYFKILNEIVGGNQKKEILPNIYLNSPQPIDVKISFKEKIGQIQTINWNGNTRSINLLNKCKVFDSSYLNGLLATRKADTTLIQPLSLNLFSYLVTLIDEFKQRLNNEADKKRLDKPLLESKYFRDEIKTSFENHKISESTKTQIESLYSFTEEDSKKLIKIKKDLEDLKQINIQDKIKLKNRDKADIESIKTYFENTNKKLFISTNNTKRELELLLKNKEKNELAKKQFEILTTIPNSNNSEWKEFIKSGEKYKSKVEDSDKICIYCRQPLQNENVRQLIKAYSDFLKDESEKRLNNSINQIDNLKKDLNNISMELLIKENIQEILKEIKFKDTEKTLFETIIAINKELSIKKEELSKSLNNKKADIKNNLPNINNITLRLNYISDALKEEVEKLSEDNTKKITKFEKFEKLLKKIQENESINKQQKSIKKWFKIDIEEKSLRSKANKINTRSITDLSKQAHNDLLTEMLKEKFKEELNFLGYKNLNVKIENAKSGKGISSTKLTLLKNNDIKAILSEGEQKAVALALFIAEAKIQKNKNPIILDDPVNSLDHKIAGKFAQELLKLENQLILFNHNRLFLDAFETSKTNHICKTINSDCSNSKGKHIRVYQINSEGQNTKGVLANYKSNRAKEHIRNAKYLLNKSPFEDELKVASLIRKTVECVIDEVIFNNQLPTKYSNKNSRIAWGELKKINNDSSIIDKLERIHSRVSGGEIHNGTENEENPIDVDELNTMILEIENILN